MSEEADAGELIALLPCEVELPEHWADYFSRTGPIPAQTEDARRFPRFYLRTAAALSYRTTLPRMQRPDVAYRVYLKDISRCSVAFIHSEQLFPRECMEMLLADSTHWFLTVVRCQKRHNRCYEVAATLSATLQSSPTRQRGNPG
jgi:hypothetical protein